MYRLGIYADYLKRFPCQVFNKRSTNTCHRTRIKHMARIPEIIACVPEWNRWACA